MFKANLRHFDLQTSSQKCDHHAVRNGSAPIFSLRLLLSPSEGLGKAVKIHKPSKPQRRCFGDLRAPKCPVLWCFGDLNAPKCPVLQCFGEGQNYFYASALFLEVFKTKQTQESVDFLKHPSPPKCPITNRGLSFQGSSVLEFRV
eukprot:150472-Amphidinium_carterae.1